MKRLRESWLSDRRVGPSSQGTERVSIDNGRGQWTAGRLKLPSTNEEFEVDRVPVELNEKPLRPACTQDIVVRNASLLATYALPCVWSVEAGLPSYIIIGAPTI